MIRPARGLAPALCALSLWIACTPTASPGTAGPAAPAAHPTAPGPSRAERRALRTRARAAYSQKDFAGCAALFEQAHDGYSAACCHAQAGARDAAFAALDRAIADGLSENEQASLANDSDLEPLHADPRWQPALARQAAKTAEHRRRLNPELTRLCDEDQADRQVAPEQIDWSEVTPRDDARRKRVAEILAAGGAREADDYFHAALVYQHGNSPDEIQRAHDLAVKAVELDPGHGAARWLAAASEDRKLMYEGKPQKWGTQFKKIDGTWVVWQVEPAITDAQRDEWNVPPLAEAQAHVTEMNANAAQPR
jgi:hypothetical protein